MAADKNGLIIELSAKRFVTPPLVWFSSEELQMLLTAIRIRIYKTVQITNKKYTLMTSGYELQMSQSGFLLSGL